MAQSQNIDYYLGSIKVKYEIDNNKARIINIGTPVLDTDAATKKYVDDNIYSAELYAGTGLTRTGNTFNVNNSLTNVTALGNIGIGSWSANTINVNYGGTGKTSFAPNQLIIGDGSNAMKSIPDLVYNTGLFNINSSLMISNTNSSTGLSTNGSFSTFGDSSFYGQVFINGNVSINNNAFINTATIANLHINNGINIPSIISSNGSFSNVSTANIVTTNITSTSLICNNITTSNIKTLNTTTGNLISNTITNGNLYTTNISTVSLINNIAIMNNVFLVNLTSSNILSNNITTGNLNTSNLSSSFGNFSTSITVPNFVSSNINSINISSSNLTSTTIINSNLNTTNINTTNIHTVSTTTSNLIVSNNISTGNLVGTNITTTNFSTSNIINTNTNSINLTSTNISSNNLTSTTGVFSSLTAGNLNVSNVTMGALNTPSLLTNSINSTDIISVNISSASLNISGNSNFGGINSTSIYSGSTSISGISTLFNTTTINLTSGNIINTNLKNINTTTTNLISSTITNGNLYNINVTSTNATLGNIISNMISSSNLNIVNGTISNLKVIGTSNFGSINCISTSTGNIYSSNSLTVPLLTNVTQTTTNLLVSNILNTNLSSSNLIVSGSSKTGTLNTTSITTNNILATGTSNLNLLNVVNTTTTNLNTDTLLVNNDSIFNGNTSISKNVDISGSLNITSNITGTSSSFGNIFNISSNIFTDTSNIDIPFWTSNYIGNTTLSAVNNITTSNVSSVYIQGSPLQGNNQTLLNKAGLVIGYVDNNGTDNSGQIILENSDSLWNGSIFTENATNKIVVSNKTFNSGIKLHGSMVNFEDLDNTPFVDLASGISSFYSTIDSVSTSTGSVIFYGGLGVSKNITCNSITPTFINASIKTLQDLDSNMTPTIGQLLMWDGSFWTNSNNFIGPTKVPVYPMQLATPVMTSNGPVSGNGGNYYITASSELSTSYSAYKCMSSIINPSDWATNNDTNNFWITVQLPSSQNINYILLEGRINNEDPNYITVQGSNDNITFTNIISDEYFSALNYHGYFSARIPNEHKDYLYYKFLFPNGTGSSPGLNMLRLFNYSETGTEGIMDNSYSAGNGIFNSAVIDGRWPMAFNLSSSGTVNIRSQFTCCSSSVSIYKKFVMYIDGAPFNNIGSTFIKQIVNNIHIPTLTFEWTGILDSGVHTVSFFVDTGTGIIFDTNDTIIVNVLKY